MISDLLQQPPGPVTAPVIGRVTKSVKNHAGGEGATAWHFQVVKLEDASGSIEAKIWKKPPLAVGGDIEFGLSGTGTGLMIEDGQYGRKLIVQESATVGRVPPPLQSQPLNQECSNEFSNALQYGSPPMDQPSVPPAPVADAATVAGNVVHAINETHPYQPPAPVDAAKERDKAILNNADLVIRCWESVVRHVVPKLKGAGYEMDREDIRSAVESVTIYTQKDIRS